MAALAAAWCASGAAAEPAIGRFERAVLTAINAARENPQAMAEALRAYRAAFDGHVVREGGDPIGVATVEGPRAVDEAIAVLERQRPLPPLDHGPVLTRAAQSWADAQGPRGALGHGSPGARVREAGGDIYVGETISYGMATPLAVVRQLIVDDGVPGRGHRTLLFSAGYRFAGVGCGDHARYGSMCVIDFAGTPDGAPILPQVAAVQPSRASAFNR